MLKLKYMIEESGYKKRYIAERIGVDPGELTRYINGTRPVPRGRLKAIARLLNVPQYMLIGEIEL